MSGLGLSSLGLGTVVAVAIFGFAALAREWRHGFVAWRTTAVATSTLALFLLAAQPFRDVWGEAGTTVLLTAGAAPADVDTANTFRLPGAPEVDAEQVPSPRAAALIRPATKRWRIVGDGLREWELSELPGSIEFEAGGPIEGVVEIDWSRRVAVGQPLEIRGRTQGLPAAAELRLHGPEGLTAALPIEGGAFELRTRPRAAGEHLYRLEIVNGDQQLAEESVDVAVREPEVPALLWLAGTPGFEARHVENWLTEIGGEVSIRTRVSRGRYRYHSASRPPSELARLTPALLAGYDVLVLDTPGWGVLSQSDREMVSAAVSEGLGLLLLAGERNPPARHRLFAAFSTAAIGDVDTLKLELEGLGLAPLAPLEVEAREIERGASFRSLVVDPAGRTLVASRPWGRGEVALSLVGGTFRWALRGDRSSHRRYWSHLLSSLSRAPAAGWEVPDRPILVDEPLDLVLTTATPARATLTVLGGGQMELPLEQGATEPDRWSIAWRPAGTGWHRVTAGDESASFYVQSSTAWRPWQRARATRETERGVLEALAGDGAPPERAPRREPLPRLAWWALLILALTALWADEQWRGSSRRRTAEGG